MESLTKEMDEFELKKTEARAVTGVLASHPNSTDVHVTSMSLTFHGQELLQDTSLELNSGRRYGLIGLNGTGKWLHHTGCVQWAQRESKRFECVLGKNLSVKTLFIRKHFVMVCSNEQCLWDTSFGHFRC